MSAAPAHKIEHLAVHLAQGGTVVEWKTLAGVSTRTAYRWAARPETKARVAELRAEFVAAVAGRLATAGNRAVSTLVGLMDAEADAIKLGSARAVLQNLAAMSAIAELRQQLQDLEERFNDARGHQG